jgi:uncharacterized protein (TIGR02246 family)
MKPASSMTVAFLFVAGLMVAGSAQTTGPTHGKHDEIPIERCDRLPVVTLKVGGAPRQFLLDTAATTILSLKSFAAGESGQIRVHSWSGSASTRAREILLPQVELGTHTLRNLKLPAIDLTPIGKACGGQIDGILGVDLLDAMGMTIDLKRWVAVPDPASAPASSAEALAQAEGDLGSCNVAFNRGDAKAMAECFDPDVVFFTQHGEYRGRDEVMRYLSQRYFKFAPNIHYNASPQDVRMFGDVLWFSYDFWTDTPEEHRVGHGMTMCRKDSVGRWRIVSMHNSMTGEAAAP